MIRRNCFEELGSVADLPGRGAHGNIRTEDNVETVVADFFENGNGTPETISGASYRSMIENFLRPMAQQIPNLWFQQDGVTAHTARQTMDLLREIFGECLI
ncbi:hypothetical protein TNIN_348381 [Trichonephila inaurata madagascariensis]|uniref:Transposase n=1 Tax=Trichonephila inaurata madagascariensis TaxID=2747483 RepID=A0A8X6YK59_9ARAC|nr:hypothetical protein TNIN_348381 [Trichonephila inaurata madagascariensis]